MKNNICAMLTLDSSLFLKVYSHFTDDDDNNVCGLKVTLAYSDDDNQVLIVDDGWFYYYFRGLHKIPWWQKGKFKCFP